jgi:hypothetical protein
MKRDSGAIGMDVDMEGDGKDGKDGKDGEDGLGASLGRYKSCASAHHACGVCGAEWTGSHDWWYSHKIDKWLCLKCQAKMHGDIGWIDYKAKKAKEDYDKDKHTGGGGGGAGDTEMCVS